MNVIFQKLKVLVPYKACLKEKSNGDFQIVANKAGEIFYLNETSKAFYSYCDGIRTIADIHNSLQDIYDVDADELANDLVDLVRDMQWNEILTMKEVIA